MPPEMMELLQGGGGGGDPAMMAAGGGDPIAALLAGAGGGAPAPEAGRPSVAEGAPGGGADPLIAAIDLIQEAIDAEADQEDVQIMLQCQAKLQQILAKNQSEGDQMLQGKLSPRGMRKAQASEPAAY